MSSLCSLDMRLKLRWKAFVRTPLPQKIINDNESRAGSVSVLLWQTVTESNLHLHLHINSRETDCGKMTGVSPGFTNDPLNIFALNVSWRNWKEKVGQQRSEKFEMLEVSSENEQHSPTSVSVWRGHLQYHSTQKPEETNKSTKHKSTFSYWQVRMRGDWERSLLSIKTEFISAASSVASYKIHDGLSSSSHFRVYQLVQCLPQRTSTETIIQTYLSVLSPGASQG